MAHRHPGLQGTHQFWEALQGAEARYGYIEFIENLCHKYMLTYLNDLLVSTVMTCPSPALPVYPATQENAPLADLYAEKVIFLKIAIAFAFDE